MKKIKQRYADTVHISGRGLVVRQQRPEAPGLASQFHVLGTGTLSDPEVSGRPDNMYQPLCAIVIKTS